MFNQNRGLPNPAKIVKWAKMHIFHTLNKFLSGKWIQASPCLIGIGRVRFNQCADYKKARSLRPVSLIIIIETHNTRLLIIYNNQSELSYYNIMMSYLVYSVFLAGVIMPYQC